MFFGLVHDGRVEVLGECVEGIGDHPGLGQGHRAVGHSGRDPGPAAVQGFGEPGIRAGGGEVGVGQPGQPGSDVAGAGPAGGITGGGQHPQLQLGQHRLQPGDGDHGGLLVGRGHEHRLHLAHRRQRLPRSSDRTQDRMLLLVGLGGPVGHWGCLLVASTDKSTCRSAGGTCTWCNYETDCES